MSITNFGQTIRTRRKRKGMTQTALAKASRVSQALISKLENGKHNPTFKDAISICKTLKWRIGHAALVMAE